MSFYYATLNSDKICIGISDLSGIVSNELMIPIESYADDKIGRKYEDGIWSIDKFNPVSGEITTDIGTIKQNKILQLKESCQSMILAGFDSTAKYGVAKHYNLSITDQINLKELHDKIVAGALIVPWHYDGQTICETWTAQDFEALYLDKENFVLNTRFYSDGLEQMVSNAMTIEEVNTITWGTTLTTEIQSQIDAIKAQLG